MHTQILLTPRVFRVQVEKRHRKDLLPRTLSRMTTKMISPVRQHWITVPLLQARRNQAFQMKLQREVEGIA